jgi:hypothetical protein
MSVSYPSSTRLLLCIFSTSSRTPECFSFQPWNSSPAEWRCTHDRRCLYWVLWGKPHTEWCSSAKFGSHVSLFPIPIFCVNTPIARNRSSQLGWSIAKGKKTLPNERKMMKFVDIAYPCICVVPKATTGIVPSLVNLHHVELIVRTPRPQHRLLLCIDSNITHRSEVTLAFQWEIGFEIVWLLMPQLRTEIVSIPTPRSHCWVLWEEGNGVNAGI